MTGTSTDKNDDKPGNNKKMPRSEALKKIGVVAAGISFLKNAGDSNFANGSLRRADEKAAEKSRTVESNI